MACLAPGYTKQDLITGGDEVGMYNEVFDACPDCGRHAGYMQICQVVLGFGNFDLTDLAELKRRFDTGDLSSSDIDRLVQRLEDSDALFRCGGQSEDSEGCGNRWRADPAKILAIQVLKFVNQGDSRDRALQLLVEAGIVSRY